MDLDAVLKKHQEKVQKNFIVEYVNEEGEVELVRLISSTYATENARDEKDGLGRGFYFTVQNVETGKKYTLNLGASGDTDGKWVAYRNTNVHKPSLRQILAEFDKEPTTKDSLSRINVSLEEEDINEVEITNQMNWTTLICNKDCEFHVNIKEVKVLRAECSLLMKKITTMVGKYNDKESDQTMFKAKYEQYLVEKIEILKRFENLERDVEVNNYSAEDEKSVTIVEFIIKI